MGEEWEAELTWVIIVTDRLNLWQWICCESIEKRTRSTTTTRYGRWRRRLAVRGICRSELFTRKLRGIGRGRCYTEEIIIRIRRRNGFFSVTVFLMDLTVGIMFIQRTPGAVVTEANGHLAGIYASETLRSTETRRRRIYQSTWWRPVEDIGAVADENARQSISARSLSNVSFVNIDRHFRDGVCLEAKWTFANEERCLLPGNQWPRNRFERMSCETRLKRLICSLESVTCALINRNK